MKDQEKRGGKEKSDKTHVKIPLCSLNGRKKNPQKQGRILEGGGQYFSGWPEYIPLVVFMAMLRCSWWQGQVVLMAMLSCS